MSLQILYPAIMHSQTGLYTLRVVKQYFCSAVLVVEATSSTLRGGVVGEDHRKHGTDNESNM